ncbi:hypothetical protein WICPIJ_008330 [Wickerhamomyces pijperi]|uniref:Uncharacterized protein n=1 Tax=Wickerhamomyces pijperi TaxID=599730 RepID=A0A9P8TJ61_WICPI|nr:hypothetical protein WICPIJ_008330 [Wickerhamomyces pijperi]
MLDFSGNGIEDTGVEEEESFTTSSSFSNSTSLENSASNGSFFNLTLVLLKFSMSSIPWASPLIPSFKSPVSSTLTSGSWNDF